MPEISVDASPAWCGRVLREFEESDRHAIALARGLTGEQINWRASEASWSIGQCLDHLRVANEVYLPAIAASLTNQPSRPVGEIRVPSFGRYFIRRYIEPSPNTARARAPRKIAPAARVDVTILDQFLRSNETARDTIRRAAAHDVNRIRFRNPFVPLLRFTVGTGFEVLSKHQARHLLQADGIAKSMPR